MSAQNGVLNGATGGQRPALKNDPEYAKYFKMLSVGLPMGAVKNALLRDGKDPDIMDGDHNQPAPSIIALKDDPEYVKYFKMLTVGLPMGAVKNALLRDGKNPDIMDLDHNKPLKDQKLPNAGGDSDSEEEDDEEEKKDDKSLAGKRVVEDGPPLKDDPEYQKYYKMLKMGLPIGAVQNALVRDGKDPAIIELDPNKSLKSQIKANDNGPPLKEDPEYEKYFKMLKIGLPMGAVKNALVRDGKDPSIMDLDPEKSLKSQLEGDDVEDDGPPLKDDPEFAKYFKMLKMGLPLGAVQNAMVRDGKDGSILELDHNKSLKSQLNVEEADTGPPLRDDPEFAKYFKMLKMGLPLGAVQNAIIRDGKDPAIMDLDPDKSLAANQLSKKEGGKKKKKAPSKPKKPKVRRKKIYWTSIDASKIDKDSLWSLLQDAPSIHKLKYDAKEFESLFTEVPNADKKEEKEKKGPAKEQKKSVQVIEGKRGMNGGIILARIKHEYKDIAEMVDSM